MANEKTIVSVHPPKSTNALWIRPVKGGFTLSAHINGKWQTLMLEKEVKAQEAEKPVEEPSRPETAVIYTAQGKGRRNLEYKESTVSTIAVNSIPFSMDKEYLYVYCPDSYHLSIQTEGNAVTLTKKGTVNISNVTCSSFKSTKSFEGSITFDITLDYISNE